VLPCGRPAPSFQIFARTPNGNYTLTVTGTTTPAQLVEALGVSLREHNVSAKERRAARTWVLCTRDGKYLDETRPVCEQGVEPGCTVDAMNRVLGGFFCCCV
jgi:hypothetical protein